MSLRRRPVTLLVSLSLVAGATIFASGAAVASGAEPSPQAAQQPPRSAQQAPSGRRAGGMNLAKVWWNHPQYVDALGLTETQRSAMDKLMLEKLETRRDLAREFARLRQTLGDQLAAGDWKAAEATVSDIGEQAAALGRGESELALAVTRLLQPAQRQKLATEFPAILHRPWLRGGTAIRRSGPQ